VIHPKHSPNVTPHRVRGLDTIRFICALWVLFRHGAAPQFPNPFEDGSASHWAFSAFFANIWSGPSAVIVFFVISGFCIHYPFAASANGPQILEFYTQRCIRLLAPLIAAAPLSALIGVKMTLFSDSILWSLFAELIYYLLYPLLRAARLRLGSWNGLFGLFFVVSFAVVATNPTAGNYASYGSALNWLLGLPCWILGCMVAEIVRTAPPLTISPVSIWAWRIMIAGMACLCSALRFHSPIGYPWTLNFFAIFAALWLHREISFRKFTDAPRVLEWAGLWSYSLYLMHLPALALFSKLFPDHGNDLATSLTMIFFILTLCFAFYLLIERPSHRLAKRLFTNASIQPNIGQSPRPRKAPSLEM
jgi:peptidoglycan/LPS O-acetylase OafA/YrhL